MAITVEDGTGLADADAFITVAYGDAYHAKRGNTAWAGFDEAAKEQAIVRATSFLCHGISWRGEPRRGREQALDWPRAWVTDAEGYAVAGDAVPREIQTATAELALYEAETPGGLSPTYVAADRVESEKIGPLSTTYDLTVTGPEAVRPVLLSVKAMLASLVRGDGSNVTGSAGRG